MDDQALEFFAWGAKLGLRRINFAPEAISLFGGHVEDGDFERERRIMSAMLPLMRTLEQGGKFRCIKYGCTVRPARRAAKTRSAISTRTRNEASRRSLP